jgi:hypothetical protein
MDNPLMDNLLMDLALWVKQVPKVPGVTMVLKALRDRLDLLDLLGQPAIMVTLAQRDLKGLKALQALQVPKEDLDLKALLDLKEGKGTMEKQELWDPQERSVSLDCLVQMGKQVQMEKMELQEELVLMVPQVQLVLMEPLGQQERQGRMDPLDP